MKTTRAQKLMAVAFACGLTLTSTNLFAQSPDFVPVGPPVPVGPLQYSLPYAAVPLVSPQGPKAPQMVGCNSARATLVLTSSAPTASAYRPIPMPPLATTLS